MTEDHAMRLLAEANPIRVADLAPMEHPELGGRRPSRRLVLAAALLVALAASLIGVLAFGGQSSPPAVSTQNGVGLNDALPGVTVEHPLAPGAKVVALADAAAAFGPGLILPDTSLVGHSDLGPVWMYSNRDKSDVTVALTFPTQGMFIQYVRPYPDAGSAFDVRAHYAAIAREDHYFHVLDLNGIPALAADQNSDDTGHNFGLVAFALGGTEIRVFGHYDQATLEAVAQSILDRTEGSTSAAGGINVLPIVPPRKPIPLGKASATLGAAVALPDASLVNPADAEKVWAQGKCPHPTRHSWPCSIWIMLPSLTLIYERPAPWPHSRAGYAQFAKHMPGGAVVDLDGVPAMASAGAHSIYFAVAGTRVIVAGHVGQVRLREIARSIVERSRSQ